MNSNLKEYIQVLEWEAYSCKVCAFLFDKYKISDVYSTHLAGAERTDILRLQ